VTTSTQVQVSAARARAGFHRLRVAAVERLTADAVAVTFAVAPHLAAAYAFTPGQHLTLRTSVDGREVRRSYSICAPPGRPLRIAVKRLEGGLLSGHVTGSLRPGDELDVLTPAGRFGVRVDPGRRRHYAAVVAGSGITPVLSILLAVLEAEPGSRFTLVDGNRDSASVMFAEEIADAKDRWPDRLQVLHVLSREPREADLLSGRLDAAKVDLLLRGVLPPGGVDEWFLCGPFGMVEQVRTALVDRGVAPGAVHVELFHVDGEPPRVVRPARAPGDEAAVVTVRLDGRSTTFPMPAEGSVLDAVLAVRPDAPYACRGGVCGTCRARLVEGSVTMARRYALEDDEVEAGFVLACQSAPTSPRLILDFDA
jgi:ring-1,2-phenylacetyl-CoA epoxidase subunit PaaE